MKGYLVIILGLAVMASATVPLLHKKLSPELEAIFKKYTPGYKTFSANIYQSLSKQATGDLVISPLSTQYTLALVIAGSKGRTQNELRKSIGCTLNGSEAKKLWIAVRKHLNCHYGSYKSTATNVIFVDNDFPIRDGYKAIAENYYRSECKVVDFAKPRKAVQIVNDFIKSHLFHIEKFLLPYQVPKTTRLLLANTLHVTAKWQQPFNPALTKPGNFQIAPGKFTKVNYMNSCRGARFGYDDTLGAKFLELPLVGIDKSIVFVLPDKKNGLPQLEAKIRQVLAFKDFEEEDVNIVIPRVNFQTQVNLRPILSKFGVRRAFNPNLAELSGISTKKGLYLNIFVQKTFIQINEVGINVGVADGTTIANRSATNATQPLRGVNFHANHPYLFYLKVAPGTPLLIGRVTTPEKYTEPLHTRNIDDNSDNNDNNNDTDDNDDDDDSSS